MRVLENWSECNIIFVTCVIKSMGNYWYDCFRCQFFPCTAAIAYVHEFLQMQNGTFPCAFNILLYSYMCCIYSYAMYIAIPVSEIIMSTLVKPEPIMLWVLPIIPSRISHNFYPLFLFYSLAITYYSCYILYIFIVSVI